MLKKFQRLLLRATYKMNFSIEIFPASLLTVLVLIAAAVLIQYAVTCKSGDLTGGWSLNEEQLGIGFTRVGYPFFAGLLLSRIVKPGHINNSFFDMQRTAFGCLLCPEDWRSTACLAKRFI
jgi:hypothetical protein